MCHFEAAIRGFIITAAFTDKMTPGAACPSSFGLTLLSRYSKDFRTVLPNLAAIRDMRATWIRCIVPNARSRSQRCAIPEFNSPCLLMESSCTRLATWRRTEMDVSNEGAAHRRRRHAGLGPVRWNGLDAHADCGRPAAARP